MCRQSPSSLFWWIRSDLPTTWWAYMVIITAAMFNNFGSLLHLHVTSRSTPGTVTQLFVARVAQSGRVFALFTSQNSSGITQRTPPHLVPPIENLAEGGKQNSKVVYRLFGTRSFGLLVHVLIHIF